MKTIVRATVIPQNCTTNIQRLYDLGHTFKLEEETLTGGEAVSFIEKLLASGGRLVERHQFVDDDDMQEKTFALFEYTTD